MEEARVASGATIPQQIQPRHISGLDGLRALAIAAVLLFHADLYWMRGGYLGVDLFFVISGFLITGLLANERERSGRVNLTQFYWRRGKRLLPAVWLLMAGVTLLAWQLAPDALPRLRRDALASFFYATNWELVFSQVSYFESVGRQPLLQHLWSLAIEEQYYIVWALLVALALPRLHRGGLALLALVLAGASALWMAVLAAKLGYPGNGDPSRLYFGTDTHGFQMLLGSALGLLWRPERLSLQPGIAARIGYWLLGLIALAGFIALCAVMGEELPMLYPWGFLLAAAASLGLIFVAVHPGLAFGRWLDTPALRWLGQRSYGIYLWHWPIYMFTRPGQDLPDWGTAEALILRLLLTAAIAELSYRYLEMPIRAGSIDRLWQRLRGRAQTPAPPGARSAGPALRRVQWGSALLTLCLMPSAAWILWRAPSHAAPAVDVQRAMHLAPANPTTAGAAPAAGATPVVLAPVQPADEDPAPDAPLRHGKDLTAVGDSVLLGTSPLLQLSLRGADVHATMGWQAADFIKQLQALRKTDSLRPVVLLHLGTNGYVYEGQLRQILTLLADRERVILVDSSVPRRWMRSNNQLLERLAPEFPNVVIFRWSDVSDGQPDYFVSDGVHLTDRGQRAYIAGIMRAGHLAPDAAAAETTPPALPETALAGDLSPTLVLEARPPVDDRYWRKLARCETDDNWRTTGARAGGLAIAQSDWQRWGGAAFAATPDLATPEQQIEVANRISTQGWTPPNGTRVAPAGFARWRCVAALRPPRPTSANAAATTYTRASVLAQRFHLGERGEVVRDLQFILGIKVDGIYSKSTRKKHRAYLEANGLPIENAGE